MAVIDIFKSARDHFDKTVPFVIYRKPESELVQALLQKSDTLHTTTDYSESGFVMAPFESQKEAILIPLHDADQLETVVQGQHLKKTNLTPTAEPIAGRQAHVDLVKRGIDEIHKGHLQKVVLARCELQSVAHVDPIDLFQNLLSMYPTAFVYCWSHPKVGLWFGATPETLLHVEGLKFNTMALAGTQEFQGSVDVDWFDKEKNEHAFVVHSIVQALKTNAASLTVSEPKTVRAGGLLHLQTVISGLFQKTQARVNLQEILGDLHPTPAVCGLPREAAKQFIAEYESFDREFYTGFLGELNFKMKTSREVGRRNIENHAYATIKNCSDLYVNLRCMQFRNDHIKFYVGGGITKGSDPESEWLETVSKSETMKRVL